MDAAEKSLLVKILETFTTEKTQTKQAEPPLYLREPKEYADKLRKRSQSLEDIASFKKGDIIVWKDGMKNKRLPEYGQPAIVIKKLDPPIKEEDDPTFMEELDITIGFMSEDDEFFVFNYDSKRFKICSI